MKKLTIKAFSLVELLVVITIMAIILAIWISINDWYKEKTYNTKVVTDLATIDNSLVRYKQENTFIPSPKWNIKYFTNEWMYAHDEIEAFWYNWFITEDTIPKKYIIVLPRDPRSQQYYAYWKTINSSFYEIAWVVSHNQIYESVVKWNYDSKNSVYNLIREYNWPDFVFDKSKDSFPYNPDEMILTARISDFTWSLTINNTITDRKTILDKQLVSWDNIKLSAWSIATIYYSDWSTSYLWDWINPLDMTLSVMKYKKKDNLATRIRIALNFWRIFTNASKMWSESNFDIYTVDTEASVRWTIFELKRLQWATKTRIEVIKWSIILNWINVPSFEELLKILEKDNDINPKYPILWLSSDIVSVEMVDWIQQSILKSPNYVELPFTPTASCPSGQHLDTSNICVNDLDNLNEEIIDVVDNVDNVVDNVVDVVEQCSWSIPINWIPNANITTGWIWNYNENAWTCTFKCKDNYNWDASIKQCKPITKIVSCTWLPSTYASWNTVNKITQTLNWSIWTPSNVWVHNIISSSTECRFKCDDTFIWNSSNCVCQSWKHLEDSVCKPNTVSCGTISNWTYTKTWNFTTNNRGSCIVTCNSWYSVSWTSCVLSSYEKIVSCWKLPSNSVKTTSDKYTQTCIWTNCTPNLSWEYDKDTCWFKCILNYVWDWNSCKKSCPSWFSDVWWGYCYGSWKWCTSLCEKFWADRKSWLACYWSKGNRYELYCSKITESKWWKWVACYRQKAATSRLDYFSNNCPWSKAEDLNWSWYYKK